MKAKKVQKAKKVNKKKSTFQWGSFLYSLKSLYNNTVCIDVGRSKKWYWALIIFFLSMIIALIPVTTHGFQVQASNAFSKGNFSIDVSVGNYVKNIESNKVSDIIFDETKSSKIDKGSDNKVNYLPKIDENPVLAQRHKDYGLVYFNEIPLYNPSASQGDLDSNGYVDYINFEVYYVHELEGEINNSNGTINTFESLVEDIRKIDTNPSLGFEARNSSYLVVGQKKIELALYDTSVTINSTSPISYVRGDYNSLTFKKINDQVNYNLSKKLAGNIVLTDLEGNKKEYTSFAEAYKVDANQAINSLHSNFKTFMNEFYLNNRNIAAWTRIGIASAINVGGVLLFGLIIFLMSRGKANPNSSITFLESYGIVSWASLLPAILAMAFSFLFVQFEYMLFLGCIGFRVMWMSMKNLRPQYYN